MQEAKRRSADGHSVCELRPRQHFELGKVRQIQPRRALRADVGAAAASRTNAVTAKPGDGDSHALEASNSELNPTKRAGLSRRPTHSSAKTIPSTREVTRGLSRHSGVPAHRT